jgi:hypothetical protein
MTTQTKTFEIRTASGLGHLAAGDIWGTRDEGVFVVVSTQPARWRGEDRDVYAHIDTWLTCRPATTEETQRWGRAVEAASARRQMRKTLGVGSERIFNGTALVPSDSATRRLDSYDDRWEPPQPIVLNAEQIAIEQEYVAARGALRATLN